MELGELLRRINQADMLISPDALELLKTTDGLDELAKKLLSGPDFVITTEVIGKYSAKADENKIPMPVEVLRSPAFRPAAAEYPAQISIDKASDISGKSKCTGNVEDFVSYFRNRFRQTEAFLKSRMHQKTIASTKSLPALGKGTEVRFIGMVTSKRRTKKGHLLLEMEDEHGTAKVLALEGRGPNSCFEKANTLLLDEVVAIDGRVSDPFIMAEDVIWPELPIREQKLCEDDMCIAFLSDIHFGSRLFMERNFSKMVQWLNGGLGGDGQAELAGKVKYLMIAGDIVDGIGIYPRQENELAVKDVYEQYSMFVKFLAEIPGYIEVVFSPGNHDAVRRAEPQPKVASELLRDASLSGNIHSVGSPASVQVSGLKILLYHGTSLDSIIASTPGCDYLHPEKPMMELLKRRNLSPIYGDNPIVPEERDYMVIADPPDIVHMGHVHKNGYMLYRGTTIINSGTWQNRTDFQVKQGHVPSPCILPVYEMKTGRVKSISFAEG